MGKIADYWLSGVSSERIFETIMGALEQDLNKSIISIGLEDEEHLALLDHFHCLGVESTKHLAQLLSLDEKNHILDIGSGIGGPSRYLARNNGLTVTGIDIIPEYMDTAQRFAQATSLDQKVKYVVGDATKLPFNEKTFDAVWIQVASANISDRNKLYTEAHRVLKPGKRIGIFDIFSGQNKGLYFPVPWADDETTNSLLTKTETQEALKKAGFNVEKFEDASIKAQRWYVKQCELALSEKRTAVGHYLLVPNWAKRAENQAKNIVEGKCEVGYIIAQRT